MLDSLAQRLRRKGSSFTDKQVALSTLPLYSPISAAASSSSPTSSSADLRDDLLRPAQRHALAVPPPSAPATWLGMPTTTTSLSRFLADFTLGFADGLTVPFALTAGLSSLGQTETVISAGMAEICAGSISMGIGGYLSAKGDASSSTATAVAVADGEREAQEKEDDQEQQDEGHNQHLPVVDEKSEDHVQAIVDRYLAPLDLPSELMELMREHIDSRADVAAALQRIRSPWEEDEADEDDGDQDVVPSPVLSGLSVALGYLIGGSLPLFPYFVVDRVGDGLLWSFVVCVIALFVFGFTKDFVLLWQQKRKQREERDWAKGGCLDTDAIQAWTWGDVRRSAWEGTLMVILGSLAALAAVLCVRWFNGGPVEAQP